MAEAAREREPLSEDEARQPDVRDGGLSPLATVEELAVALGNQALIRGFLPRSALLQRQAAAAPATDAPPAAAPAPGPAPDAATGATGSQAQPSLSPEAAKKLAYAQTVLSKVGQLSDEERASLDKMVGGSDLLAVIERRDKLREELKQARIDLESTKDISGADKPAAEKKAQTRVDTLSLDLEGAQLQVEQGLKKVGVATEEELVELVNKKFPELWKKRAKEIAGKLLDQNEEAVRAEGRRYDYLNQYSSTAYDDSSSIRLADREIAKLAGELMMKEFPIGDAPKPSVTFTGLEAQVAAGAPQPVPTLSEEQNANAADVFKKKETLLERWKTLGLKHPILYHPSYKPGYLDASGDENIAKLTGEWAAETLEKIGKTRKNVDDETISTWQLKEVPDLTFDSLGVARDSVLGKAVGKHFEDKKSDEEGLRMALESFALTFTILATAIGGPAGLLAGAIVQGAVTAYGLSQDLSKASAVNAASGVALDPELAKFTEEEGPDGLAVLMDVVALGMSVLEAIKAAKALKSALAALKAGGAKEEFVVEARKHLGDEWKARALGDKVVVRARAVAAGEALEFFDDYRSAHRAYMEALKADPTLEVGIWRDRKSGRYVLGYGDASKVEGPIVSAKYSWEIVKHHHPGSPVVATIRDRLPSAEDYKALMAPRIANVDPSPARSMITWIDESGKMRYTTFGMDPNELERYWVRYTDAAGEVKTKRFMKDPWADGKLEFENWAKAVEDVEIHGAPTRPGG